MEVRRDGTESEKMVTNLALIHKIELWKTCY